MYWTIVDVIRQLEHEDQEKQGKGGGTSAAHHAPADVTEMAFEQMVKEKKPRPD